MRLLVRSGVRIIISLGVSGTVGIATKESEELLVLYDNTESPLTSSSAQEEVTASHEPPSSTRSATLPLPVKVVVPATGPQSELQRSP